MPSGTIIVDLTKVPEVMARLRRALANLLVEAAQDEEPRVAQVLLEVASAFEVGEGEERA